MIRTTGTAKSPLLIAAVALGAGGPTVVPWAADPSSNLLRLRTIT